MRLNRFWTGLLVWVFVLLLGAGFSQAVTIRHDRSDSQYTAYANNSFPAGGILSGDWLGSGTLISPTWVLTAGHVLDGVSTFQTKSGNIGVAETILYPGLDIGLARLESPLTSIAPVKLYDLDFGVEDGQQCIVLGAGQTGTGLTGEQGGAGTRRAAQTYVYANASSWGWGSEKLLTWFREPGSGAANLEGGSAHGDSGGGLLLDVSGEYAIAGVMTQAWYGGSGGDTIGKYDTGGVYVRSAPLNDWILQYATDAVVVGAQAPSTITAQALVVTDTSQVRLYKPDLTSINASVTPGGMVTGAKFLTNGNVVVTNDTGQLQLYKGTDLSPIGSPLTFAGSVSEIVPLANGNFAVAANHSDAGTNHGVWLLNGTTGTTINQNTNWNAPVTHLIETSKGNIVFAVDPSGAGGGSVVLLDGPTGNAIGLTQNWGTVGELTPLANDNGDVLFTATNDTHAVPGTPYSNTWGTINGTTGGYKYSNPNWDHMPTVAATENGEIVWNGVDDHGSGPLSFLYRSTAEGANLASHLFAVEPVEQIVELHNGNIAYSLLNDRIGDDPDKGLRGEVHISNSNMTGWFGSSINWDEAPVIAAIPNTNGDLFFQGNNDGNGVNQAIQFDGTTMANVIASQDPGVPDIGEIIELENGNVFFSTSGGADSGGVYLLTSGTEESTGPRFLIDSGAIDTPLIAGGKGDNYILHAGEIPGGKWFIWAGSGTGTSGAPYDIGGFTEAGGAPLFIDYFYSETTLFPGDFDGDGAVDVSDLGILATYYGTIGGADLSMGDANGDGNVDVTDLGILATNYGTVTSAVAIPEPSTLALVCLGALALLMRRRKR